MTRHQEYRFKKSFKTSNNKSTALYKAINSDVKTTNFMSPIGLEGQCQLLMLIRREPSSMERRISGPNPISSFSKWKNWGQRTATAHPRSHKSVQTAFNPSLAFWVCAYRPILNSRGFPPGQKEKTKHSTLHFRGKRSHRWGTSRGVHFPGQEGTFLP